MITNSAGEMEQDVPSAPALRPFGLAQGEFEVPVAFDAPLPGEILEDFKADVMTLYTFIVDYHGGTYISQVSAPNPRLAIFAWVEAFEIEVVPGLGVKSKQQLLRSLRRDEEWQSLYVALDGLTNAWCATAGVRGKRMLINFVATQSVA